ncbi:LysR substrate-binding domain-containing protein [Enterococcus malodoratus]|uniref:LysR substrate-binding domain-containing protein n=1 Tax=Enterococcus malodoratus TaxID=71451 RepID=UPI003FD65444
MLDFTTRGQKKTIDLISYYPDSVFQEAIDHYLKERDIVLNCSMQLWSAEAIKKNVMSRMGVAYLPEFALTEELAQGTLIPVATELDEEIIALYAYHKNKYVTKQMQLFLSLIEEVLG